MNCELLTFSPPPSDFELEADQIHVWAASLDQTEAQFQRLYQSLSQDECDRAGRFVFEKDRRHFAVCRGVLRNILARYLNVNAENVSFKHGRNGKPELADFCGNEPIYFNLSHSEGLALYAFRRDQEIGVDIEYMRDISNMDQIAERIFSVIEIEVFRSTAEGEKKEAFFSGWTRKEAIVKGLGKGLSLPLQSFEAPFIPGEPARLISIKDNAGDLSGWTVQDLKPAFNYAGALAMISPVFEPSCWRWDAV